MTVEYKVVPAPKKGLKAKGRKTNEDRFANALESLMNEMATDGWSYLRTDTLPTEQREGLMSKTTVYVNMLVFSRPKRVVDTSPRAAIETPHPDAEPNLLKEGVTDLRSLRAIRNKPRLPQE